MSDLANDNVYQPRGGYMPMEPAYQAEEREDAIAQTLAAIPLLKAEVEHLDGRIAFYESIHSIQDESLIHPDSFMHIVAANKIVVQILTIERDSLLDRIRDASKE